MKASSPNHWPARELPHRGFALGVKWLPFSQPPFQAWVRSPSGSHCQEDPFVSPASPSSCRAPAGNTCLAQPPQRLFSPRTLSSLSKASVSRCFPWAQAETEGGSPLATRPPDPDRALQVGSGDSCDQPPGSEVGGGLFPPRGVSPNHKSQLPPLTQSISCGDGDRLAEASLWEAPSLHVAPRHRRQWP